MLFLKILVIVVAIIIVLYFLMIMPRLINRPDRSLFVGKLYAHRGLHDNRTEAPENSMAAFRKAVDAGYGIELDVQLSKDKVPVVFHDFTLARVARYDGDSIPAEAVHNADGSIGVAGKVEDYTYAELQQFHLCGSGERIPRFADVLKMVDGRVPLIVELKIELFDTQVCPLANDLLQKYQGVYCIESFNPLGLWWYRRHASHVMRGQLSDDFHRDMPDEFKGPLYFILTYLLLNFLTRPDFVAYNHKYQTNLSRRICHALYGNVAAAWTIKDQMQLEKSKGHFDMFIFDSFIPGDDSGN